MGRCARGRRLVRGDPGDRRRLGLAARCSRLNLGARLRPGAWQGVQTPLLVYALGELLPLDALEHLLIAMPTLEVSALAGHMLKTLSKHNEELRPRFSHPHESMHSKHHLLVPFCELFVIIDIGA